MTERMNDVCVRTAEGTTSDSLVYVFGCCVLMASAPTEHSNVSN